MMTFHNIQICNLYIYILMLLFSIYHAVNPEANSNNNFLMQSEKCICMHNYHFIHKTISFDIEYDCML